MTREELKTLSESSKVKSFHFDIYSIYIEFENGMSVTIEASEDFGVAIFEIESNIDKERQDKEYEERMSINKQIRDEKIAVLSKLNESEVKDLIRLFHIDIK